MDARTGQARAALEKDHLHQHWQDALLDPPGQRRFFDRVFAEMGPRLGASPGATILDAGCGPGHHAIRLARNGWRVHAVDFSEAALEFAARNVRMAGLEDRVELSREDLLNLSLADRSFQHVQCWGVLMHIPDVARAIAELARVLTAGGRLVISELNARAPEARILRAVSARRGMPLSSTASGWERWHRTRAGYLMVRQADPCWLTAELARHGLALEEQLTGQITESHTVARRLAPVLTPTIDRLNQMALWSRRLAPVAISNVLVYSRPLAG